MNKAEIDYLACADQHILTISELNRLSKHTLEQNIGHIVLTGEISNLAKPSSGHIYFTLKDEQAQIRCAMFRHSSSRINFPIENGQSILAEAKVSLYEARGDYQLIINTCQLAGEGLLQLRFEQLKKKLEKEGLFDASHKKNIPAQPQCIGIITSPTGAAIHDILSVLNRRYTLAPIIIYPCQVQGNTASRTITEAIETANQRQECDVLILTRGGGSLEDLWCFNNEDLAHSIARSQLPIITGIGHEVDTTIADLAADQRAATPSAAAECVSPALAQWHQQLKVANQTLIMTIRQLLSIYQASLISHQQRLRHPKEQFHIYSQRLDQLEIRLKHACNTAFNIKLSDLTTLSNQLHTLSPLQTLERGYAIAYNDKNKLINSCKAINKNERITIKFKDGEIATKVINIDYKNHKSKTDTGT